MCWYLFHALFFTFLTPVYTKCRCFVFSSIFPLHNCIKVCSSLKSILSITIFYVVGKPLFLCVFVQNGLPYIFLTEKSGWRFLVILYIFHIQNRFSGHFLFHCIIFYTFNTDTWWEQKMLSGLICSRRNRDVNKQRRCCNFPNMCDPKHFIK